MNINPLVHTNEWKTAAEVYRTNLLQYQPGNWYFGMLEDGLTLDDSTGRCDKLMTMEDLLKMVKSVSPISAPVSVDSVEVVNLTYEEMCERFPFYDHTGKLVDYLYDYQSYSDWLSSLEDVFYYARGREDYSQYEGIRIAASLGYKKVILENLS